MIKVFGIYVNDGARVTMLRIEFFTFESSLYSILMYIDITMKKRIRITFVRQQSIHS